MILNNTIQHSLLEEGGLSQMVHTLTFKFRITEVERYILRSLAGRLKSSQAEAIRILIYRAADDIGIDYEVDKMGPKNNRKKDRLPLLGLDDV
jgi:hypothetical protein